MDFHLQSSWRFHLCTLKIPCYFLYIKKQLFQQEHDLVLAWLLLLDLVKVTSADTSPSGIPVAILSRKRHEQRNATLFFLEILCASTTPIPSPSNSMQGCMWWVDLFITATIKWTCWLEQDMPKPALVQNQKKIQVSLESVLTCSWANSLPSCKNRN